LDLKGFAKNGKLPAEDRDKKTQVSGEIPVFFFAVRWVNCPARLMRRYRARVPDVEKVPTALVSRGIVETPGDIANDHIAF